MEGFSSPSCPAELGKEMCCMWKTEAAFSPFPPRWTTPAIEWSGRSPFRGPQPGGVRKMREHIEKGGGDMVRRDY